MLIAASGPAIGQDSRRGKLQQTGRWQKVTCFQCGAIFGRDFFKVVSSTRQQICIDKFLLSSRNAGGA